MGHSPRLRGHLTDDEMEERDDDEGEDESGEVGDPQRQTQSLGDRRDPMMNRGLRDRTQCQCARRDAQLGTGEEDGELGGAAQRRSGRAAVGRCIFQPVAFGGDEGEFHGDEERAEADEEDSEGDDDPGCSSLNLDSDPQLGGHVGGHLEDVDGEPDRTRRSCAGELGWVDRQGDLDPVTDLGEALGLFDDKA